MANTYNTSTLVGQQIVQSLHARTTLPFTVNTAYARDYKNGSYNPGETVTIDIDDQPNVVSGLVANVRDKIPTTSSVTVAGYNTSIKLASLKRGYSTTEKAIRTWTDSMVKRVNREIEVTGFEAMAKAIGNNVGVNGTDTGSIRTWAEGRAKINDQLNINADCYAAVNPMGMVALTEALKGAPNPKLSNSFVSARMKNTAGLNFYQTPSVWRYTAGTTTDGAGAMSAASTNGATTLAVDGLGTGTITAGTKVTVATVNAVDPETKADLGYLKEFVVDTDVTIAGNAATLNIFGAIYDSTDARQNVSALPANNDVVTLNEGGTLTTIQAGTQNLIYDKDAATLVCLPLPLAEDGSEKNITYQGLTFRVGVGAKDHVNDTEIIKVSALWGWAMLRADHACVVFGA